MSVHAVAAIARVGRAVKFIQLPGAPEVVVCVIVLEQGSAFVGSAVCDSRAPVDNDALQCAAYKRAAAQALMHLEALAAERGVDVKHLPLMGDKRRTG